MRSLYGLFVLARPSTRWYVLATVAIVAMFGGVLAAAAPAPAAAAIVVTTTADAQVSDGVCSLREALINANSNDTSGSTDCAAGSGNDVILFSLPASSTIRLSSTLPTITDPAGLTIRGPGASQLTISGDTNSDGLADAKILAVTGNGSLDLVGTTITKGGPGIDSIGALAVSNSTFSENGPGIVSSGPLTVTASTFSRNTGGFGGAIVQFFQPASVTDSVLTGNTATWFGGGAIWNEGHLTVIDSTVSGNSAAGITSVSADDPTSSLAVTGSTVSGNSGAGISTWGSDPTVITNTTVSENDQGGLDLYGGVDSVINSTVTGNSGGAGISDGCCGILTVTNSTVSENSGGGGIFSDDASLALSNSVLSGNRASAGIEANCAGTGITDGGYNVSSDSTCVFAGTSLANRDPMLGPLAENGGATKTLALLTGSPALDLIPPGVNGCGITVGTDQRGVARPQGVGCDAGAFEATIVQPPDSTPPTITSHTSGTLGTHGWYTTPVSVSWTVSDSESSILSTSGCDPTTITADTAGTTVTCQATSAGGTTTKSVTIKLDTMAPNVDATIPADGGIYRQGASILAAYSCTDDPSGIDSCTGDVANGDPIDTSVGPHTFTVTARDNAGHTTTATHSYFVATASQSNPQAWGDVKLAPGSTLRVGYDFKLPGKHPVIDVLFVGGQVAFAETCASGTDAGTIVVPIADQKYAVALNSPAWYPSGDQNDDLVYQGSANVPDLCAGGQVHLGKATFAAGILASQTVKLNYRWHYVAATGGPPGPGGNWSDTYSVTPDLIP